MRTVIILCSLSSLALGRPPTQQDFRREARKIVDRMWRHYDQDRDGVFRSWEGATRLAYLDKDKDGEVSKKEFADYYLPHYIRSLKRRAEAEAHWAARFGRLDSNRDGVLSKFEWKSKYWLYYDSDQNGEISHTEWMKKVGLTPPNYAVGMAAPDFRELAIDGKIYSLKSFRGKILLIDFWSVESPACRGESVHIRDVYRRYHDKGFEVLSVSLDDRQSKVQRFTRKHGIVWPQICEGTGWRSGLVVRYGIRRIPAPILIDRKGIVQGAGVHLRGAGLEIKLKQLLKTRPDSK